MKTKNIILIFAISLFFVSSCGIMNKTNNKDYFTSHDENFKVNFPGTPSKEESNVETDAGTIPMVTYMYEGSNSAYMIACADYPMEIIKASELYELLEGAKGGYLGNLGLTVTKENNKSDLDGVPGVYFEAEGGGYYTVVQDYLLENRLYQIAILRLDRAPTQKEINDFIKSFEFLEK